MIFQPSDTTYYSSVANTLSLTIDLILSNRQHNMNDPESHPSASGYCYATITINLTTRRYLTNRHRKVSFYSKADWNKFKRLISGKLEPVENQLIEDIIKAKLTLML